MAALAEKIKISCWSAPAVKSDWRDRLRSLGVVLDEHAEIRLVPVVSADDSWIENLTQLRQEKPDLTTVVITSSRHQSDLIRALNLGLVDFVADRSGNDDLICDYLKRAAQLAGTRKQATEILLRARDQNRQLERLTQGLEDLVHERTQTAVDSKSELEKRLSQLREILRFMQELGHAASPEDVLTLLRRELKTYHRLQEPVLAFAPSSGDRRLAYFRAGTIHEKHVKTAWPQSLRIRQNDPRDSQYLADEFGRPVGRTVAIPLVARKTDGNHLHPTLFFEHQFTSQEVDGFLTHIGDRLQVVTVGLDRLLLEYDLRSATYLWEHTFDGLEDPIAIVDVEYQVTRTNKAFEKSAPSNHCYESFQQASTVCSGCPLGSAMSSAQPQRGHVRRGSEMYAVHSYPILIDPKEEPTTAVNYYLNVTDSLGLQERMVQTEKMAALGHLAGHIAHELNNPLTGIRGLAQVWVKQPDVPETVKQDLTEIEKAAERSQTIITNLLHFTQGGRGDQVQVVDLKAVIHRTLPFLKTALSQHRFDLQLPEADVLVAADAQLLQQVIFNLLKNACQAIPQRGEVRLVLKATAGEDAWQILISDSGVGIEPDQLETIFTPFYTTKAKGDGTGLGLSLSRSIVRRFGGDITVRSTVGKGTDFCVTFPKGKS